MLPLKKKLEVGHRIQVLVVLTAILLTSVLRSNAQSTVRTLFLGNSYTGVNNLPQLVHDVALSAGDNLVYDSNTPGGYQLVDHNGSTTSLNKITNGTWDYVVIQGQSQEPVVQSSDFVNGAIALRNHILQSDSCTVVMPYMTWGRENGDASTCPNFPVMCTYESMDAALRNKYLSVTQLVNGIVSPVSVVWNYIRTNHPGINLYQTDGSHPSPAGSYAAACCFYTVLFNKSPALITYNFGLDPTEAAIIRNAVKTQVFDTLTSWNFQRSPIADFNVTKISDPYELKFTPVNQGIILQNYFWSFGDGATSTLQSPSHTYASNGSYNVTLVTSNCNTQGWNTATKDTVVQLCAHSPSIYTTNAWLCNYDTLWTQTADDYQWFSGGEAISGETGPYLANYAQYNNSGTFSVVSTANSCSEVSEEYFANPAWSGYYFDALGNPCSGDTVNFAVLHQNGSLSGNEIILWFKDGVQLTQISNEDTLNITEGGTYEVKVVNPASNCPDDTTSYSISYNCSGLTIKEMSSKAFARLYPNPASEKITVEFKRAIDDVELQIFTIDGRLVKTAKVLSSSVDIDISDLSNGIYWIRINQHDQSALKFVKE